MGRMSIKDIIIDSLKYSASNLKILLLLGMVLVIADLGDELAFLGDLSDTIKLIISAVVILIAIFEAGYVFRILEETIKGSNSLPELNNFKEMFIHGLSEMALIIIYFVVPVVLVMVLFLNFIISYDIEDVTVVSGSIFLLIACIAGSIFALFPAVMLHRANNNTDLRSSFDIRAIYHKIRKVGLKRLIIVYFTIIILVATIREALVPSMDGTIPLMIGIISDLLIAPYLLIFTSRVLGLLDN
ncbi:MAG: DUF4013 domain-containing protein [Methanobacterium sp.]|nr:DUF4013 domain-containing protein [Methanobacterium sp.]